MTNRRQFVQASVAGGTLAGLGVPVLAQSGPLKVGFVYVSPIGDAGWTTQHNMGRLEMEKALAGKVTSSFVEKVREGADAERVIREMATSGHRLIFATSFKFRCKCLVSTL